MTRGITSNAFACPLRAELPVVDGRFLYVPLTDLEGSEMMRTTSRLQTFQLLKPTPWCRSTDVEDTMQSNAEAGESWQGNFVLVADVAFLAVEMATEPPSRCDACCLRVSHHVACLLFVDVQATILASWFKRGQTQCTASAASRGGCVLQVLCVCVSLWGFDGLTARCDSTWVPTNLTMPPPPASPSAPG